MTISDLVSAASTLLSESIFLVALRAIILIATTKFTFGLARSRAPLILAFGLWLALFLLYLTIRADATDRMFIRFEVLLCAGAVIGIGYSSYQRLIEK